MPINYSKSIFNINGYKRKLTKLVDIGDVPMGGDMPIRVQTMTNTNTNNTNETVEQSVRAIRAGAEYIRITAQGIKEAKNINEIVKKLNERGFATPIIADIHFNPKVALEAVKYAHKIRINPGNYTDKSRNIASLFSEDDYKRDLKVAEEKFSILLDACKHHDVAIRIGVNHGSLSQRIMRKFGDTPKGMAFSAIEFLQICQRHNFEKLVVSMKSSNTRVMVQATRYLVELMKKEGMNYPLHLGVTEAGEGEDGRIKSAVGIGALLIDGIGDTIRVSLTEEPENEIPVAKSILKIFDGWENQNEDYEVDTIPVNPFDFSRRETIPLLNIGGENQPAVMANLKDFDNLSNSVIKDWGWSYDAVENKWVASEIAADYFNIGNKSVSDIVNPETLPLVGSNPLCQFQLLQIKSEAQAQQKISDDICFVEFLVDALKISSVVGVLKNNPEVIAILSASNPYGFFKIRNLIFTLIQMGIKNPCITSFSFVSISAQYFPIHSSAVTGSLFIDGLSDGLMVAGSPAISHVDIKSTVFSILQASRVRITKTEFISCPGCGRTLFNLYQTLQKVKKKTAHLKGLKIAVMGCVVNGPGEMADADYGYVGSGSGTVNLYRKKEVIKKNIPESIAVVELINLIKSNEDWIDPPVY